MPKLKLKPKRTAPIFAALGDPTRLRLVIRLSDSGPLSITELAATSKVTRQAVTKHLHTLEAVGLVRHSRRGRQSVYELDPAPLADARARLALISDQWDAALSRLKNFVESDS